METVKGDLWDYCNGENYIVVTSNLTIKKDGCAVLGRGVAAQAVDRFPNLPEMYGSELREQMNTIHGQYNGSEAIMDIYHGFKVFGELKLIMLPVKFNWSDYACDDLVDYSLNMLRLFAKFHSDKQIYMPVPAIGFGEMKYSVVRKMLKKHLGKLDNVTVVKRGSNVKDAYPEAFRKAVRQDKS